ncbi:hypothetical protein BDB00DRAFT_836315 [Zychaea mexicana]|uniref:uncharacterized protein n=1 Tax=Zychaea mexicana TaxID=64656 RepID=UPI0022FF2897|nr:uncharacterized protein BDB00DRAFT_836315 [Zychaea mexicana]KAI9490843.1 hypothetical protein BDB00DRAFT_836315 [Zychaea mexicana]
MMEPSVFLSLTSEHHVPEHEHDHSMMHEDMERRWHGCDWSTHESVDLLYFEPGISTAELLQNARNGDDGFIRLTPENSGSDDDDSIDELLDNQDDLMKQNEFGVSTHEPQLVILYENGQPFVQEPAALLVNKPAPAAEPALVKPVVAPLVKQTIDEKNSISDQKKKPTTPPKKKRFPPKKKRFIW